MRKYAARVNDNVDEGGHLHLYFETKGVAEFADRLKAKGVELAKDVHETAWNTREIVVHDDQGHTLYFGEPIVAGESDQLLDPLRAGMLGGSSVL